MRCLTCGHWNSCPRCSDWVCVACGEDLETQEQPYRLTTEWYKGDQADEMGPVDKN